MPARLDRLSRHPVIAGLIVVVIAGSAKYVAGVSLAVALAVGFALSVVFVVKLAFVLHQLKKTVKTQDEQIDLLARRVQLQRCEAEILSDRVADLEERRTSDREVIEQLRIEGRLRKPGAKPAARVALLGTGNGLGTAAPQQKLQETTGRARGPKPVDMAQAITRALYGKTD